MDVITCFMYSFVNRFIVTFIYIVYIWQCRCNILLHGNPPKLQVNESNDKVLDIKMSKKVIFEWNKKKTTVNVFFSAFRRIESHFYDNFGLYNCFGKSVKLNEPHYFYRILDTCKRVCNTGIFHFCSINFPLLVLKSLHQKIHGLPVNVIEPVESWDLKVVVPTCDLHLCYTILATSLRESGKAVR